METRERIILRPGCLIEFYAVDECQRFSSSNEVLKKNKANFTKLNFANLEKKRLEKKLDKSWQKDDEGRFYNAGRSIYKWYIVEFRKIIITE